MYVYSTIIYKNNADFASAISDFETNFKATAKPVDEAILTDNVFLIGKTYTDFKSLIAGLLTWADVRFIEANDSYRLILVVSTIL